MLKEIIRELIEYKEFLRALTWRNIKIRYKQTIMGFLWAIFMPTVIVLSGIIVKKALSILSGRPLELKEVVSVSIKSLPWAFFIGAIKFSVGSLTGNINLIKKLYFPRVAFPISYIVAQLFDFLVAGTALSILLVFTGIGISLHILYLPLVLSFLILLTMGLGMILSCGNVFFRDVKYIVDVILTFGIFFTPVFYDAAMFGKWKTLLLLNPVGSILESINSSVVLHKTPDLFWLGYAGITSLLVFMIGLKVFHKYEPLFAEVI